MPKNEVMMTQVSCDICSEHGTYEDESVARKDGWRYYRVEDLDLVWCPKHAIQALAGQLIGTLWLDTKSAEDSQSGARVVIVKRVEFVPGKTLAISSVVMAPFGTHGRNVNEATFHMKPWDLKKSNGRYEQLTTPGSKIEFWL